MKNCYFTYKGIDYPKKEDLLSVIKAELDIKDLIAPVETGAIVQEEEKNDTAEG